MKTIDQIYINGEFVTPHGNEFLELLNPATNEVIGQVRLADETDAKNAVAAAKNALEQFSKTSKAQRMEYLQRLHDALLKRQDDLALATMEEYGAPQQRALWSNKLSATTFIDFKNLLNTFEFERATGISKTVMEPVGIAAIFTSWNSNAGSICIKLAPAIAAGCTVVIKPSEMSAMQTQILTECFHDAGLPAGVINVVTGRGDIIGTTLSLHPDISKIAFTGSSTVGKLVAKQAIESMKRVTLELSGKSPNLILADADLQTAIPMAVNACFMNNGQACIAASRLIVPEHLLPQVNALVKIAVEQFIVGNPSDDKVTMGPLASVNQYKKVQDYMNIGINEGAELLIGGLGHPEGLDKGNFVKPTVFTNVKNEMRIAQEEIFGPVLSIIAYKTEDEAIAIANDTIYGLQAYISSADVAHAKEIASALKAGRVSINTLNHDPFAPFGGFKQSGIGREGGIFGLEEYLEPKAILG